MAQREAWLRTADHIKKKQPATHYLLLMLSTFHPACVIFNKDYVKPRTTIQTEYDRYRATVPNPNNFFYNLPPSKLQGSKKGRSTYMVTKAHREE